MLVIFLFAIDATIVSTSMPTIVARLGGLELYSWFFDLHADFGADDAALRQVSGSVQPPASDAHRHRHFCARIDIVRRGSKHGDAGSFSRDSGLGGGAIYALAFIVVGVLFLRNSAPRCRASSAAFGDLIDPWSTTATASTWPPAGAGSFVESSDNSRLDRADHRRPQGRESRTAHAQVRSPGRRDSSLEFAVDVLRARAQRPRPPAVQQGAFGNPGAVSHGSCGFLFHRTARGRTHHPPRPFSFKALSDFHMVSTLAAMGVFGAISYLPLYLQGVLGMSASGAGMILLFLSLGWTAGSLIAGHGIDHWGTEASPAWEWPAWLSVRHLRMTREPVALLLVLLASLLIGVGMGMANLTTLVSAQSAVPIRRIGAPLPH